MVFKRDLAVYCQNHMEHTNTLCGENVEFKYDKAGGIYSNHNALKSLDPSGGGLEYLHRSPASRKTRRKGNPVPGGITGPPCSWGI
jgi:hypothetical protein